MVELAVAGILLIIAGFAAIALSLLKSGGPTEVRGAGVVLVGPIPIAFGSDAKWLSVALALAVALIILSFGLRLV